MKTGHVVVVSAPSGAGKRTVIERVLAKDPKLEYSISATTRPPRPGEQDGVDYYFLAEAEFRARLDRGEFVEWAPVHGNYYGTPRPELERRLESGKDVLLEIDVQGMRSIKRALPDAMTVFIAPPSMEELERRIRTRGANTEDDIALRLRNARDEMAASGEFDYLVVNGDLEEAVDDVAAIIRARRCRVANAG